MFGVTRCARASLWVSGNRDEDAETVVRWLHVSLGVWIGLLRKLKCLQMAGFIIDFYFYFKSKYHVSLT
jgi:hypothetical protein